MEAVPRMPMLAFQLKISAEPVEFAPAFKRSKLFTITHTNRKCRIRNLSLKSVVSIPNLMLKLGNPFVDMSISYAELARTLTIVPYYSTFRVSTFKSDIILRPVICLYRHTYNCKRKYSIRGFLSKQGLCDEQSWQAVN